MALAAVNHAPTTAPAFDELSLGEVFDLVHDGLRHLSLRMSSPEASKEFAQFTPAETAPPENVASPSRISGNARDTLPALLQAAQSATQLIAGVQSRLDGFTNDVFARPKERAALLGLPEKGKLAYRDPSEFLQGATNISRHEAKRRSQHAQ